jgi:hypothetical protein
MGSNRVKRARMPGVLKLYKQALGLAAVARAPLVIRWARHVKRSSPAASALQSLRQPGRQASNPELVRKRRGLGAVSGLSS